MAYQLRSRGDPVTTESQEQTDILEENLTEYQVTTPSHVEFISSQLSTIQSVATATAEANRAPVTSDISTKPDVETHPQLDIQGPTRPDPDLDSAPSTAGLFPIGTHLTTQQLAPAQASAYVSVPPSLAEEVGPPSTVSASRDYIFTTNETQQLYDTINSLLSLSQHDRQEVKQTTQKGDITLAPNVVVARTCTSSFHTSSTQDLQQSESVAEQQEWSPGDDSIPMPDLSPHYADLELSPAEMATLPETVLASLLSQAAIPSEDIAHILATRQRASPLPPSTLQSVAPSPTEPHPGAACAISEDFLYSTSLLGSSSKENRSSDAASTKTDEGNASFVSDSTALGDTDIELLRTQKTWLPKSTETLDAHSVHTDKTVVPQTSAFSQVPHHSNPYPSGVGQPILQQPQPRYGTISKVSHWLTTQTVTPCATPASTVHAISRAVTEASTMPLGMEASMLPGRVSSQTSHRTRSSKRTRQSSVAEAILQFGTQMTTNLMNMAEQHRLDAMRREDLLRQEAAEKEKLVAQEKKELAEQNTKREQMLIQAKKESEEKILENEFKRQKLQAAAQMEIERRRNAAEANNLMAQTEMFERREIDLIARKERDAEIERERLQKFYEQRIALDKKYFDEKEKRLKCEAQLREQNLKLEQKEQLVPIPTSGNTLPTFAKPTVPPKVAARTTTSFPRMPTTLNLASTKPVQPQLGLTNMGFHTPLLTATPRLSTALAYATAPVVPEAQPQTLQPIICADNTQLATVTQPVLHTCTSTITVPYCTTVNQSTGSTSNVASVNVMPLCDNATIAQPIVEKVAIPASMPVTNLGISQNAPMTDTTPKFATLCCIASTQAQPTVPPQQQPQAQTFVVPSQTVPTVVVRPPTTPKLYKGDASYKAYKEYFERLSVCNGWTTPIEKAQNLIISLDGPAAETVRGLEIKQDQDYDTIWELLRKRFSYVDDPERQKRLFDTRKQQEHESVAMFEQALRSLFREAWPKTDIKSADADSNLQRHFVNNLRDSALQNHLRLHARTDTFGQTVEKARIFVEASELTATPSKSKPVVRFAEAQEPETNSETSTKDKVLEGLEQVLRAVLQNPGFQRNPSPDTGRTSPQNQNSQNNQANSGSGNNPRGRYFSPPRNNNNNNNNSNNGNGSNRNRNRNRNWNSPNRGNNNNRQNYNNSGQSSNQGGTQNSNTSNNQNVTDSQSANQSAQPNSNRNGSQNQRQFRNSGRNRSGCFICGTLGCHSWFHEQNRNRLPAETGRNQNSSRSNGQNVQRFGNKSQTRCPSCFNFSCQDPQACIDKWRRDRNLRSCPNCWRKECPGPASCESEMQQRDIATANASQVASSNQPSLPNSVNDSPNANRTTVRGNPSPSSSVRPPQN